MKNLSFGQFEDYLELIYKKLPPLTDKIRSQIVYLVPYFIILTIILILISGLIDVKNLFSFPYITRLDYINRILYLLTYIIFIIILGRTYKPLKNKSISGWKTLLYLNSLILILTLISSFVDSITLILFSLVSYYFLFQIKNYYR